MTAEPFIRALCERYASEIALVMFDSTAIPAMDSLDQKYGNITLELAANLTKFAESILARLVEQDSLDAVFVQRVGEIQSHLTIIAICGLTLVIVLLNALFFCSEDPRTSRHDTRICVLEMKCKDLIYPIPDGSSPAKLYSEQTEVQQRRDAQDVEHSYQRLVYIEKIKTFYASRGETPAPELSLLTVDQLKSLHGVMMEREHQKIDISTEEARKLKDMHDIGPRTVQHGEPSGCPHVKEEDPLHYAGKDNEGTIQTKAASHEAEPIKYLVQHGDSAPQWEEKK